MYRSKTTSAVVHARIYTMDVFILAWIKSEEAIVGTVGGAKTVYANRGLSLVADRVEGYVTARGEI